MVLDMPRWSASDADGPPSVPSSRLEPGSALIERCRLGDPEAFKELFRLHRQGVLRLVQRMLGRSSELEDVVQDVFLQVHRSIRDFKGQARFTTWLYRVAVNVVLMHRRSARSRPVFDAADELQHAIDAEPLPDEQLARNKRIRAFYRLLERLTEKKRTVFVLHEFEGINPTEIAKIVDAPVLTVRTRLFYARRELAAMLREEPDLSAVADEIVVKAKADKGVGG
jgi:RNA polymerase sigma-70 factor (ECF subfamily)